jgi:FKBP-type peptidyl-prolyl cis-trans isomerase 2
MKIIIQIVVAIVLMIGCKKEDSAIPVSSATLKNRFEVKPNESVQIKDGSGVILVKLVQVNDSRCPVNANCIRAGEAKVKLDVNVNGVANNGLELCLACDATMNIPTNKTIGSKYKITLVEVSPFPELLKGTGETKIVLVVE